MTWLPRVLRIPLTLTVIASALLLAVPAAMSLYAPYLVRPGFAACAPP